MAKAQIKNKVYNCYFEVALDIMNGKWKALILWHLQNKTLRYGELKKLIPNITQKMLTQKLRELEEQSIINRKVYPEVPPKVEYSLTEYGKTLKPILKMLYEWGYEYTKEFGEEVKKCEI